MDVFKNTFFNEQNVKNIILFVNNNIKERYYTDLKNQCNTFCREMCMFVFDKNKQYFINDLYDIKQAVLKMNTITITLILKAIEQKNKQQLESCRKHYIREMINIKSIPIEMTVESTSGLSLEEMIKYDEVKPSSIEIRYVYSQPKPYDKKFYFSENDEEMHMFVVENNIIESIQTKMNQLGHESYRVSVSDEGYVTIKQNSDGGDDYFSLLFEQTPNPCHELIGFDKRNYEHEKSYTSSRRVVNKLKIDEAEFEVPRYKTVVKLDNIAVSESGLKITGENGIEIIDYEILTVDEQQQQPKRKKLHII